MLERIRRGDPRGVWIAMALIWGAATGPAVVAAQYDDYAAWRTCRDDACAYQFHLHSGTPSTWWRQATDPTTDPRSAAFQRCAHSCKTPEVVYQDCLDTGLDGCAINHHSGDFGQPEVLDWVRAADDVHVDRCGGTFRRDPAGFRLDHAGGYSESGWDYVVDRARKFAAEHPGFLALAEIEWTVSAGAAPPSDAAARGGHKTSLCSKPMRPYCEPGYGPDRCASEADLYAVARGDVTRYPPDEAPQRCTLAWVHPCGQGNASKAYLGPFNPVTGGGSDYALLTGYAIRPRSSGEECLLASETAAEEEDWVGLSWHALLDRGVWVAPISDADYHHYQSWGANQCGPNATYRGGRHNRTYCWVTENSAEALVEAREDRRCYFAQGRVRLETRAWGHDPTQYRFLPADATLGGALEDPQQLFLELEVERVSFDEPDVQLDRLELWHNGVRIDVCSVSSDPDCVCNGQACRLFRGYRPADLESSGGLDGWYALIVRDVAPEDGQPSLEVAASVVRVNWSRFPAGPSVPAWPYMHTGTAGEVRDGTAAPAAQSSMPYFRISR